MAERSPLVWFEEGEIRIADAVMGAALAPAYAAAAERGLDMRQVVDVIEACREQSLSNDPFDLLEWMTQSATSDGTDDDVADLLGFAMQQVLHATKRSFIEHLLSLAKPEQERAWILMISNFLETFEINACVEFLQELPDTIAVEPGVRSMLEGTLSLMRQERWDLTADFFEALATDERFPLRHRAIYLSQQGLVEMYYGSRLMRARQLITEARQMARDPQIESAWASWLLYLDRPFDARLVAFDAMSEWPEKVDFYRIMADASVAEADYRDAESWYRRAEDRATSGGSVLLNRIGMLAAQLSADDDSSTSGRDGELGAEIERLAKREMLISPGERPFRAASVSSHYRVKRTEDAIRWAKRAVEEGPGFPTTHLALGNALLTSDQAGAEEAYLEVKQLDTARSGDLASAVGQQWFGADDAQRAAEWHELAVDQARSAGARARERVYRAMLAEARSTLSPDESRQQLTDLLNEEPGLWAALRPLLDHTARLELDEARPGFERLLDLADPGLHHYVHNRHANTVYDEAIRADDPDLKQELFNEAIAAYEAALEVEPRDRVVHRNLAGAYREAGDWDNAERHIQEAFEIEGSERERDKALALVYNARGNHLYNIGEYRESVPWYQKAAARDPSDAVLHGNLGGALVEETSPDRKLDALRQAVRAYENAVKAGGSQYEERLASARDASRFAETYGVEALEWTPLMPPLILYVSMDLVPFVTADDSGGLRDEVQTSLNDFRAWFKEHLGVTVPGVTFRDDVTLDDGGYRGEVFGEQVVAGAIELDRRLFTGNGDVLTGFGIAGEATQNPYSGKDAFWVSEGDAAMLRDAGERVWTLMEYPIFHLMRAMLTDLKAFIGYQEVVILLGDVDELVAARLESVEAKRELTRVVNGLVAEQVTIRPFEAICVAVADGIEAGKSVTAMVEDARSLPELRSTLPGARPGTRLVKLDPETVALFERSVVGIGAEPMLAMQAEDYQRLHAKLATGIGATDDVALLVDEPQLRPHVRRVSEFQFPGLPVLSTPEIDEASHVVLPIQSPPDAER